MYNPDENYTEKEVFDPKIVMESLSQFDIDIHDEEEDKITFTILINGPTEESLQGLIEDDLKDFGNCEDLCDVTVENVGVRLFLVEIYAKEVLTSEDVSLENYEQSRFF